MIGATCAAKQIQLRIQFGSTRLGHLVYPVHLNWWAKLAAMIGRFVGYVFHTRWMMQMIYVDDLHGAFVGPNKFKF